MKKYYSPKQKLKAKKLKKLKPLPSPLRRSWGLATRLEHRRIKGKNRKRPGREN